MNKYIEEILKLAKKAEINDDVPVGAIVVYNNKIIGRGYNKKQKSCDVTNHAEVIAIRKAAKLLKDWRLNGCELYVTLEPCNMCKEIIKQSRINRVYYLAESHFNNENNSNIKYTKVKDISHCEYLKYIKEIQEFFKSKR